MILHSAKHFPLPLSHLIDRIAPIVYSVYIKTSH